MTTHLDLRKLADKINVTLTHHTGRGYGYYHNPTRTITTRRGLTVAKYRTVLAHELAHAIRQDQPTGNPHYDRKQEMKADRIAAELLIAPDEWEDAKRWCQGSVAEMAAELEVSPRIVEIYAQYIERKI